MKYLLAILPLFISINLGGTGEGPGMTGLLVLGFHAKDPNITHPRIGSEYINIYSFEM